MASVDQGLALLVGRTPIAVRRLFLHRRGRVDETVGAVEIVWDGTTVTRIDTRSDRSLLISDRAWSDPFARSSVPVELEFDAATVVVRSIDGEPVVDVVPAEPCR